MNILFVENHPLFAETVTRQFLSQHCVTVAPSLSAARQALVDAAFDVLLVDYDLDDGKGDELIKECAQMRLGSAIRRAWGTPCLWQSSDGDRRLITRPGKLCAPARGRGVYLQQDTVRSDSGRHRHGHCRANSDRL